MDDKYLEIDTTGWTEISCDKCGSVTSFSPEHPEDQRKCLMCAPTTPLSRIEKEGGG